MREEFSALHYDCLELGVLGAPRADSLDDRAFVPADHIEIGEHTCGAFCAPISACAAP